MTRTILSQDSANWWQHTFCCEFASIATNANHYLSQSLTVAWLIFGSSSIPNLSLATGPVLSRDLFYAWASPEYRDSLANAEFRLRRLSQIGIRLAFLHGLWRASTPRGLTFRALSQSVEKWSSIPKSSSRRTTRLLCAAPPLSFGQSSGIGTVERSKYSFYYDATFKFGVNLTMT